jgi:hypothetical protein
MPTHTSLLHEKETRRMFLRRDHFGAGMHANGAIKALPVIRDGARVC